MWAGAGQVGRGLLGPEGGVGPAGGLLLPVPSATKCAAFQKQMQPVQAWGGRTSLSLASPDQPGLPQLSLFVSVARSLWPRAAALSPLASLPWLCPQGPHPFSAFCFPILVNHSACPFLPSSLLEAAPHLSPTNSVSPSFLSLGVSLSLLFSFAQSALFPPLSLPPACRPIWLAGGGEICGRWGGGEGSRAFCLPFVSQRTWENCGLSRVGHDSGSQLPSPGPAALFPGSPTPPHSSRGGLELGRGLSRALKGSLSRGGRVSTDCSGVWGGGAEGRRKVRR